MKIKLNQITGQDTIYLRISLLLVNGIVSFYHNYTKWGKNCDIMVLAGCSPLLMLLSQVMELIVDRVLNKDPWIKQLIHYIINSK